MALKLNVLVCTLDEGIRHVPDLLLPPRPDVDYIVSFQYTSEDKTALVPPQLTERADVTVYPLPGRGLSANRNHAFRHATGDVLLIADDDNRYRPEYFDSILQVYEQEEEVDIALFRVKDHQGKWLKSYPEQQFDYSDAPRSYYPCSPEITLRRRVVESGLHFNEHFGLGASFLCAGEEDVFLCDALRRGLTVRGYPYAIAETDGTGTGLRFLTDMRVQRSKGAVFCYVYGWQKALWLCLKEALFHAVHHGILPGRLFRNMWDGITYCRRIYGKY